MGRFGQENSPPQAARIIFLSSVRLRSGVLFVRVMCNRRCAMTWPSSFVTCPPSGPITGPMCLIP